MKTIGYSSTAVSRDGVRTRSKQLQVAEGDVIGGWQVTGVPTRGLNGLQWSCRCTAGHEKLISHSALSYSAVPTCTECQQSEIAVAIETRRYEKSVLRASSFEVTEQGRQRRIAQAAQDAQQQPRTVQAGPAKVAA